MYSASEAFDTEVKKLSRTFCTKVLYGDNNEISDVVKTITIVTGSCGADSYATGVAFSGYASLSCYGDLSALAGEELEIYIGLKIDGEAEYVRQGFFTIKPADITKTKDMTTFTAYDRITSRCEAVTYESELSYPCDVGTVVDEIAEQAGVTVIFSGFSDDVRDTQISDPINTSQTCRAALAEVAGTLGGFVYANADGDIVIAAYPTTAADSVDLDRMIDSPALDGEASGYDYQAGTIRFMGDPRWCPEDAVEIEADDVAYMIPCMYIEHSYDGGLTTTVTAPSALSEDNTGPLQAAIEKLEDEVAVSGMRTKQVTTEDGGAITYFYNASTLAESTGVIRISDQGIQFTASYTGDDDTTTWYGLDLSGDLLAAIISASGLTLGGKGNGNGTLTLLDDTDGTIAVIDNSGLTFGDNFTVTPEGYLTAKGATLESATVEGTFAATNYYIISSVDGGWLKALYTSEIEDAGGDFLYVGNSLLDGVDIAGDTVSISAESLYVSGATTISKTLKVSGAVTLSSTLTAAGNIFVDKSSGTTHAQIGVKSNTLSLCLYANYDAGGGIWDNTHSNAPLQISAAGNVVLGNASYTTAIRGSSITIGTSTVGASDTPVYISSGTITKCSNIDLKVCGASGTARYAIGTTDSTSNYQVDYINSKEANSNGYYYITVNAKWETDTFASHNIVSSSSDIRLKTNVADSELEALPVIRQMRTRQYDWKESGLHQNIGFIADELEEIDASLSVGGGYDEDGSMNVKSINTLYMLGYVVKGLQETGDEITALKAEIKSLKEQLAALAA